MSNDSRLQQDVIAELEFEPSIDHTQIGVTVTNGVVTLTGFVRTYIEKMTAEKCARRVHGVRAIAEELEVRLLAASRTTDTDLAERILNVFKWDASIPKTGVDVKVEHGRVTLTGEVDWHFQQEACGKAVGRIHGVTGVNNLIHVKTQASAFDVRQRIVDAFKRSADIDASTITVITEGGKVTLGGKVRAWHERATAERAAWAAPGVTKVEDNIILAF